MAFIDEKERREILGEIKDFLNDINIATEMMNTERKDMMAVLLSFLDSSDETLWADDKMPEDPHAASIALIQFSEPDAKPEDVFTRYLLLYFKVCVDVSDIDEIKLLRLINEMNSTIAFGHFFYAQEAGDVDKCVHFKHMIGAEEGQDFDEGVVGEAMVFMGEIYDEMKEKLLALKESSAK